MSTDKPAKVPRGAKSTLKPTTPREFIVVVGGPCNTFNGWGSWAEPPGAAEWLYLACAAPRTRAEITRYLTKGPEMMDVTAMAQSQWARFGWSDEAVQVIKSKNLKGHQVKVFPPKTHDIYWGNFVTPAARIFASDDAWPAPRVRPKPGPGDIVTFLVYVPAYEDRGAIDWRASPYNPAHRTKPDAAKYWGSGSGGSAPSGGGFQTAQDKIIAEKKRQADAAAADKDRALDEDDVNFHILMRTTSENTAEYVKRPKDADHYVRTLYEELLNSVKQPKALTKLLLVRKPGEIIDYIAKGVWKGKPIVAYNAAANWDNPSEEELAAMDVPKEEQNFGFSPPRPVRKDTQNRPLKWTLPWYPAWDKTPEVDRAKVKVARFDYVGHSEPWAMLLEYGWNNAKGQAPDMGVRDGERMGLGKKRLDACFAGGVLTADAHAMMWGCNLGAVEPDPDVPGGPNSGLGVHVTRYFKGGVVAAESTTNFTQITHSSTNMPFVDDADWVFYPYKKP